MNKKELAQEIMVQMIATGITTKQIEETLTHAFDLIREVAQQKPVKLKGFGSFRTVTRQGRPGRNPKTGEAVEIPTRQRLTFKPAA